MSPRIGSRPAVGSSKKTISGSVAIARASATRFCMPPDSSDGDSSATSAASPTCASFARATSRACRFGMADWLRSAKATFSQTFRESNRAPLWKSMPIFSVWAWRARPVSAVTSAPSIWIDPASGHSRPRTHFSMTDLPEPEPPITTTDSPAPTLRSTPSSTVLAPKDFFRPRSSILDSLAVLVIDRARSSIRFRRTPL